MRGRERVSSLVRRLLGVVHLQDPGHRLLFQPFPDVSGMDPGSPSQLVRCLRTLLRQLSVQAEAISEVDGQEIESAQAGLEQPTHERSGLLVQVILTPQGLVPDWQERFRRRFPPAPRFPAAEPLPDLAAAEAPTMVKV